VLRRGRCSPMRFSKGPTDAAPLPLLSAAHLSRPHAFLHCGGADTQPPINRDGGTERGGEERRRGRRDDGCEAAGSAARRGRKGAICSWSVGMCVRRLAVGMLVCMRVCECVLVCVPARACVCLSECVWTCAGGWVVLRRLAVVWLAASFWSLLCSPPIAPFSLCWSRLNRG